MINCPCSCFFSKVVLFHLLLILCVADGRRRRSGTADTASSDPSPLLTQRLVLEKWVDSMNPERDYNGTEGWHRHLHSRSASDIFAIYNLKFSDIAKSKNAIVYFASLGACDGTADKTIRERYLKFPFWQGVFVEPVGMNFADLTAYLDREGALNRSTLIRAAATSICAKPTIEIERPLYEEKDRTTNKSTPHWLRRQIASIVPSHRSHAREGWTKEAVRCITAGEVLTEWTAASSGAKDGDLSESETPEETTTPVPGRSKEEATAAAAAAGKKKKRVRRRRPHVLKIDVEGHDYDVLMSFVMDDTPVQDLPLMIEFEAKRYPFHPTTLFAIFLTTIFDISSCLFIIHTLFSIALLKNFLLPRHDWKVLDTSFQILVLMDLLCFEAIAYSYPIGTEADLLNPITLSILYLNLISIQTKLHTPVKKTITCLVD